MHDPAFPQWMKEVQAMPAQEQIKAVSKKLMELNPEFDGKLGRFDDRDFFDGTGLPKIENGFVTGIGFYSDKVYDISPIRAFSQLTALGCNGTYRDLGVLEDIAPLEGMKLSRLSLADCKVSNLKLLQGMPLTMLNVAGTKVSDLIPLRGMALHVLHIPRTKITDLSPLSGMPLRIFSCPDTQIRDITPLKGMSLSDLACFNSNVNDLSPLSGMPLVFLKCQGTKVTDLSPLRGMPLVALEVSKTEVADVTPLATCDKLQILNLKTTRVTATAVAALQKALPNCKIEWDDPAKTTTPKPATTSKLFMHAPDFPQWIAQVQAMPAKEQAEAVGQKLIEVNPQFKDEFRPYIKDGMVVGVAMVSDFLTDLSPLRALPTLRHVNCAGRNPGKSTLSDLSPLRGLKLTILNVGNSQVSTLSPLDDMQLLEIRLYRTKVSDLSPLAKMPLTHVAAYSSAVTDLSPLLTCQHLTGLDVKGCRVIPAAVAALQKALPNCKIEWDDPSKPATPTK